MHTKRSQIIHQAQAQQYKVHRKKLPEAPEDAEVTGIRKAMIARRYEAIENAKTLLNDLNHVIGDEVSV